MLYGLTVTNKLKTMITIVDTDHCDFMLHNMYIENVIEVDGLHACSVELVILKRIRKCHLISPYSRTFKRVTHKVFGSLQGLVILKI